MRFPIWSVTANSLATGNCCFYTFFKAPPPNMFQNIKQLSHFMRRSRFSTWNNWVWEKKTSRLQASRKEQKTKDKLEPKLQCAEHWITQNGDTVSPSTSWHHLHFLPWGNVLLFSKLSPLFHLESFMNISSLEATMNEACVWVVAPGWILHIWNLNY